MPSRWTFLLIVLFSSLSLLWGVLHAAEIYSGIDEQGNRVFSDRPLGNGEPIELITPSVVPLRRAAPQAEHKRRAHTEHVPFVPYSTFAIGTPQDGQTLPTGHAGNLQVELDIAPKLRDEDRVRLLLDGQPYLSKKENQSFTLTNLERGEHTLQAELLDADGQVRHRSAPLTLYVQRASVNLPRNPNNPAQ